MSKRHKQKPKDFQGRVMHPETSEAFVSILGSLLKGLAQHPKAFVAFTEVSEKELLFLSNCFPVPIPRVAALDALPDSDVRTLAVIRLQAIEPALGPDAYGIMECPSVKKYAEAGDSMVGVCENMILKIILEKRLEYGDLGFIPGVSTSLVEGLRAAA